MVARKFGGISTWYCPFTASQTIAKGIQVGSEHIPCTGDFHQHLTNLLDAPEPGTLLDEGLVISSSGWTIKLKVWADGNDLVLRKLLQEAGPWLHFVPAFPCSNGLNMHVTMAEGVEKRAAINSHLSGVAIHDLIDVGDIAILKFAMKHGPQYSLKEGLLGRYSKSEDEVFLFDGIVEVFVVDIEAIQGLGSLYERCERCCRGSALALDNTSQLYFQQERARDSHQSHLESGYTESGRCSLDENGSSKMAAV